MSWTETTNETKTDTHHCDPKEDSWEQICRRSLPRTFLEAERQKVGKQEIPGAKKAKKKRIGLFAAYLEYSLTNPYKQEIKDASNQNYDAERRSLF